MGVHVEIGLNGIEHYILNNQAYYPESERRDMAGKYYWHCTKCDSPTSPPIRDLRDRMVRYGFCKSCDTPDTRWIAREVKQGEGGQND